MSKRRAPPDPNAPIPGEDLAPRVRLLREEVEVQPRAAIPLHPDEPQSPVVPGRRARTVWVPDVLRESGAITKAQYEAARRYRDDWETAEMPATPPRSPVYAPSLGAGRVGYQERRMAARIAFNRAKRALGEGLGDIAYACILHNASLRAYAATKLQPDGVTTWPVAHASGYLRAAIETLEEHYRPSPRR